MKKEKLQRKAPETQPPSTNHRRLGAEIHHHLQRLGSPSRFQCSSTCLGPSCFPDDHISPCSCPCRCLLGSKGPARVPSPGARCTFTSSGTCEVTNPGVLRVNHQAKGEDMAPSIPAAAEAVQQKMKNSSNEVHWHKIGYTEKGRCYRWLLRELVWVSPQRSLWGLLPVKCRGTRWCIFRTWSHDTSPSAPDLPNTNWSMVADYMFLLPVYCKCVRNHIRSDPLLSLWEILLSTLTVGYVCMLDWLSWLRWCGITAWLR